MTNKEFLQRYVDGMYVEGAYGRMAYKNGRIISYETPICDINRVNKTADVNIRKYSATTSRMQNNLLAILKDAGYSITTYDGPGAYMWDACDRRKVTSENI